MLRELAIRNFAIIEDLRIRLDEGLTIFSGETGTGKSVIINAVHLLLGGRAASKLVRTGAESAELEALFTFGADSTAADRMRENDFDPDEELVIRRVISAKNQNRVYINGRLATMQMLSEIAGTLASISGQHAHQRLLREEEHLLVLDRYAGLLPLREEVSALYHRVVPLMKERQDLERKAAEQERSRELLSFQRDEIAAADLHPGEDLSLEAERQRLRNAETLYRTVHDCVEELYASRGALVERLGEVEKRLQKAAAVDPPLGEWAESAGQIGIQIEDMAEQLRDYLTRLDLDGNRLEAVEERLDRVHRLKRKYGDSVESILERLVQIEGELSDLQRLGDQIADLDRQLVSLREQLGARAEALSRQRNNAAIRLSTEVEKELRSLRMEATEFHIALTPTPPGERAGATLQLGGAAVDATGMDRASFRIAPNPGEPLKPLNAIASGGELSRLVLALKAILADTDALSTVIFDEVDAGIGGEVAEVVGRKLADLAGHHQVVCITHLPQIARFGDHHFRVIKETRSGRTRATIQSVDRTERIREIARMLGGETITSAVMEHARELIDKDR